MTRPSDVLAWLPPDDPPPLTISTALSSWTADPFVLVPFAIAAVAYLAGVRTLRRRGDPWPTRRIVGWLAGLAVAVVGVSSALGVYDRALFQVPAIQHMLLQMIAPVGLVMGAPTSLALRTLPRTWRRRLLVVLHSRWIRLVSHPAMAFTLFAVTQFAFYYTPLYTLSLTNAVVHDLMHLHFVAIGFLFYWALLGLDPTPHRVRFSFRLLLVLGMGPVHILLGVPIMLTQRLFAADFYTALGRDWGPSLLDDQHVGGAILWAFGDISAAALVGAFVVEWYRSDSRLARRTDRQLDRLYGTRSTITPWWLTDAADTPDVAGPQRDGS